jgi:hypothetical protein
MEPEAQLKLLVVTARGNPVSEPVEIYLANRTITHNPRLRAPSTPVIINGLYAFPNGTYQIEVSAPCYHSAKQFLNIPANGHAEATIMLPTDARRVQGIKAPTYENLDEDSQKLLVNSNNVLNYEGKNGLDLYNALDDIRRAGFLNLTAKAKSTRLDSRTVLSYLSELLELRGDRFFAKTARDLRSAVTRAMSAHEFHEVNEALHNPPTGYERDRSFKTMDHYGNLQLSFFKGAAGEYTVDMDIDDAQGFEHIFQVLENTISGQPTHPYNIHEILLAAQHLDAGYDLVLPEATMIS